MTQGRDNNRDRNTALLEVMVWPDGQMEVTCRVRTAGGQPDRIWLTDTLQRLLHQVRQEQGQ